MEFEAWQAEREAGAKRRRIALAALVILGLILFFARGPLQSLAEELTRPRYDDPPALGGVDLRRVHAELLPDWLVVRANGGGGEAEWAALQAEAGKDPNLAALLERVRGDLDAPWDKAPDIIESGQEWSRYLDSQGQPWLLELGVVDLGGGPFAYPKAFRVVSDLRPRAGETPLRVRLAWRVDGLNVRENNLGHVADARDGGLGVLDRMLESCADRTWPLLDPAGDADRGPVGAAFAEAVRREGAALVPAEAWERLVAMAPARARLISTVEAVNQRGGCSNFAIQVTPIEGFSDEDLRDLKKLAQREEGRSCPALTPEEAEILAEASEALREAPEVVPALLAFVARGITVHEARHVADGEGPERCEGCVPGTEAEVSAYLASFRDPGTAATSLFQACDANEGVYGTHAVALDVILRAGELSCEAPPPADLQERARRAEELIIGQRTVIFLPDDFPTSLALQPG